MSVSELYESAVRSLPLAERLQLVSMIMNDVTASPLSEIPGYSDEWSDEDLAEASAASMRRAYADDDLPDDISDYDGVGNAQPR